MPTDTMRARKWKIEDFDVTAIGDLPEIDVQSATGVTTAILAAQHGGVVEIPMGTSDDDDLGAVTFGGLNYHVAESDLECEIRMRVETTTDPKWFTGFGDSIATADETSFSATTDSVTIDTMSDGAGFLFDNDATTKNIWCVAGASDAVTVGKVLGSEYNLAADEWATFRVWIAKGGRAIQWSINGKEVHAVYRKSDESVLVGATATLVPGVWNYEQGTAADVEIDFIGAGLYRSA